MCEGSIEPVKIPFLESSCAAISFAQAPAAVRRFRPDWQVVVSAAPDYVLKRAEVDSARIVLSGWSVGGLREAYRRIDRGAHRQPTPRSDGVFCSEGF